MATQYFHQNNHSTKTYCIDDTDQEGFNLTEQGTGDGTKNVVNHAYDENKGKTKDMMRNLQRGIVKKGAISKSLVRMKYEGRQLLEGVSQDKLTVIIDRCLRGNEDFPNHD